MALQIQKISNPLTLIAVFASLAEIAATAVLPILTGEVQADFAWFVMLFPVLLVGLFFLTLNFNNRVLYAPSDYSDEANFLKTLTGGSLADIKTYVSPSEAGAALRRFWKPDGTVNKDNEKRLRDWMKANGLPETPITMFLYGDEFDSIRAKAVAELQLV